MHVAMGIVQRKIMESMLWNWCCHDATCETSRKTKAAHIAARAGRPSWHIYHMMMYVRVESRRVQLSFSNDLNSVVVGRCVVCKRDRPDSSLLRSYSWPPFDSLCRPFSQTTTSLFTSSHSIDSSYRPKWLHGQQPTASTKLNPYSFYISLRPFSPSAAN